MEYLILAGLALWLFVALRSCLRSKGGCSGNCAHCTGCRGKR